MDRRWRADVERLTVDEMLIVLGVVNTMLTGLSPTDQRGERILLEERRRHLMRALELRSTQMHLFP